MSEDNRHPEAEIIPPGAAARRWQERRRVGEDRSRVWVWSNDPRYGRLRSGRPGPLSLIAIVAGLALLGTLGFFVFLGALAITLPLIAALVLVGLLGGILRRL